MRQSKKMIVGCQRALQIVVDNMPAFQLIFFYAHKKCVLFFLQVQRFSYRFNRNFKFFSNLLRRCAKFRKHLN